MQRDETHPEPPAQSNTDTEPVLGSLILEDGSPVRGFSFGAPIAANGEVVFNTGMVGYPESLSDPSYRGQILVLTYPLVGNYGVPIDRDDGWGLSQHFESDRLQVSGLIVSDYSADPYHWSNHRSLGHWLNEYGVPALYGIDTRALTKRIRTQGAMLGKIVIDGADAPEFADPNARNLVAEVSTAHPRHYGETGPRILVYDCGVKTNILRLLLERGVQLDVVPWDHSPEPTLYDGVFISNGPGNPAQCAETITHLKALLASELPIFGICLGHQLLARAAGAHTYKLKFGHRGQNQPCVDLTSGRCYITPQNHGFAVDSGSLPEGWLPYFENANDGTNEGLRHVSKPVFSVQFHPEAKGGPSDTEFLFDRFLDAVESFSRGRNR